MDARYEDYQRMRLRFARSLNGLDPARALREFGGFGRRFAQDRDSLPQTDADRAFHLMALAVDIVDNRLPFIESEEEYAGLSDRAVELLEEALHLDERCYDAARILDAADETTRTSFHDWLERGEDEVRAWCEAERDRALAEENPSHRDLAARLAMNPYLRWLDEMAGASFVRGSYRTAVREGLRLLDLDETDPCGVHHTLMLTYAKLEDESGMDALLKRLEKTDAPFRGDDAWTLLSRMALMRARGDEDSAEFALKLIVANYPSAVELLLRQSEVMDGVFARVDLRPYSADELCVALAEASVLLQEGANAWGRGVLGSWVVRRVASLWPDETHDAMMNMAAQELGDTR